LPAPEVKPVPIPQTTSDNPVCDAIANDEALRSLPDALLYLFGPSLESEAKSVIREAITSLNRISQDADGKLSYKLKNTAAILDILISAQTPTEEMVNNAADALTDLGSATQDLCGFSDT
jgi:ABC-type transporter Mla subunit MlaD